MPPRKRKELSDPQPDSQVAPNKRSSRAATRQEPATSSTTPAQDVVPQTKSKGKAKAAASIPEEKRLARFRASCPKTIEERLARARSQRFYMIERNREGLKEEFKVLGSTGNVYTVTIAQLPTCDCPDGAKGNHCKHILFVFTRVLGVSELSGLYYQKALLTSELEQIFAQAPPSPTSTASSRVVSAYSKAAGKAGATIETPETGRKVDGEDCPICYEEMEGKTEQDLARIVFCGTCQNGLHTDCFKMWAMKKPVTCVYCRAPWAALGGEENGATHDEGYLNLASAAGMSTLRDTSTYYQGPRRGKPYWNRGSYY
ncbi:hypothetical protein PIIN_00593 [Serendipita indica DSM 11827]|uniref:SWIM-type domain-containing protein n=1 Tax=Serendipita indica (strain DSM 11827) TaxID=1109443 RepID=G4T6B1_SERID|nr:hypothetical protein PIIN_00593 [Serendipita indica DSM 11827]